MNLSQEKSNRSLLVISKFAKRLSKEKLFSKIVYHMAQMAKELVDADRCTIWLYDELRDDLWTKVSQGVDDEIRIPSNTGIVGYSLKTKKPIVVNDPYSDARFNKEVDINLGYKTESILTYPIFAENDRIIGVFQTINKSKNAKSHDYLDEDIDLLSIASSFGSKILIGENYERINDYNKKAQEMAFEKQKTAITNEIENDENFELKIIYKPADVLTGDIYSIYKTKNGGVLVFVVDAMGHGIMPALTSYAIASLVKQHIKSADTLHDIGNEILKSLHSLMAEGEQVSCFFMWFDENFSKVNYFGGGMYPPVIKTKEEYLKIKSNNPPFMSFSKNIKIDSIELNGFDSVFLYSDGIIENDEFGIDSKHLHQIFDDDFFKKRVSDFLKYQMDDDVTMVLLKKLS